MSKAAAFTTPCEVIHTTLYDLLACIGEACDSEEEIIATLEHLLATHRVTVDDEYATIVQLAA
ncbi:MAG: hypothetical protein HYY96_15525 [Candidatus Tectomicrobia bacterium]|nr:hypothetical protein [Candidatus Tectomicrobia bacterium]